MTRPALLLYALALLSLPSPGQGDGGWQSGAMVGGAPYHSAEELRSFYKLSTGAKSTRKGAYAIGNADVSLELGPGAREMRIGGVQVALARPLQRDTKGGWLISREDWVSSIDPILRPTYIQGRESVQTVVIDAGHGGHDEGERTTQLHEAEVTLQVAQRLKAELEKRGYKTLLTRTGGNFLSDQQRVEAANAAGEHAIFLSLHVNSGRSDFRGAAVYSLAPGEDERPGRARQAAHAALAYAVQSALITRAGAVDAGCRRAHYSLLSSITCPAVWVELGYATHAQEGAALASPAYQETLAQALAQGVEAYAHVANPETGIPVQAPPPRVPVKQPVATPTKGATESGSRSSGSTARNQPRKPTANTGSKTSGGSKPQATGNKPQSSGGRRASATGRNRR